MRSLDHFAEPRPSHGGLVAEGALNLLGRPDMNPLTVLVRETVQNSWDARAGRGQVHVSIVNRVLSTREQEFAREFVFANPPPKGLFADPQPGVSELQDVLGAHSLRLLTLTDRGTSGLGGPVRADRPASPGEPTHFVDLVFNIGQPSDKSMSGGTYGFGKTISFLISSCRTVIIHTNTRHDGGYEQRLIVQSVGQQYATGTRNFTGRHWWGVVGDRGAIEPLTGAAAGQMADGLGLPAFGPDECGTTIAVVAPDYGARTGAQAMQFIAEALLWNFWPKMVGAAGQPPSMTFSIMNGDEKIPVPDPAATAPLKGYVQMMQAVRDCESGARTPSEILPPVHVFEIRSKRPIAHLGWLGLQLVPRAPGRGAGEPPVGEDPLQHSAAAFTGPSHHVALMRRAELVVRYLPGPALTTPGLEWCGVFRAAEGVDHAFAASEPPTHDAWQPSLVPDKKERSHVNVALREIRDFSEKTFTPRPGRSGSDSMGSGVLVAEALAGLIAPTPGAGASLRPGTSGGGRVGPGRSARAKVVVHRQWLADEGGGRQLNVEFSVVAGTGSGDTAVEVTASAASSDGGAETERPVLADVPEVLSVEMGVSPLTEGGRVIVPATYEGALTARIRQPDGVAAVVDITVGGDQR